MQKLHQIRFVLLRTSALFILFTALMSCTGKGLTPEHIRVETENGYSSGQDFSQVTMDFSGKVKNTYTTSVKLQRVDWHLFRDDKQIQSGTLNQSLKIAAGQEGEVSLRLSIPTPATLDAEIHPAPLSRLRLEAKLILDANGTKVVKNAIWLGEHFEPMRPKLILEAGTARHSNMAELVFTLSLQNTNQFKLVVDKLEYLIKVMGVEIAKGNAAQGQILRAGAIYEYDISKIVGKNDFFDLAKTIGRADTIAYEAIVKIYSNDKIWSKDFKDKIVF